MRFRNMTSFFSITTHAVSFTYFLKYFFSLSLINFCTLEIWFSLSWTLFFSGISVYLLYTLFSLIVGIMENYKNCNFGLIQFIFVGKTNLESFFYSIAMHSTEKSLFCLPRLCYAYNTVSTLRYWDSRMTESTLLLSLYFIIFFFFLNRRKKTNNKKFLQWNSLKSKNGSFWKSSWDRFAVVGNII